MSEAYRRARTFYQDVSVSVPITAATTTIPGLVPVRNANYTLNIQKIHVKVTTGSAGKTWTFQDTASVPVTDAISTGNAADLEYDFGPAGFALTPGAALSLAISAAGAVGSVTVEAYQRLTTPTPPSAL